MAGVDATGEEATSHAEGDPDPVRIALVDDHPVVRQGLADLLVTQLGAVICFSGETLAGVLGVQPPPDLLVLDLDLGSQLADPGQAQEVMERGTAVLVISALGSPAAIRAMVAAGVNGFVSKQEPPEVLLEAARTILAEGVWTGPEVAAAIAGDPSRPALSPQEERVLVLYASGLKIEAVARRTDISAGTAKTYLKRVRAKYAERGRPAPTKTDLYREARRDGLIEGPRD